MGKLTSLIELFFIDYGASFAPFVVMEGVNRAKVMSVENNFFGLDFIEFGHILVVNVGLVSVKVCRFNPINLLKRPFQLFERCRAFRCYLASFEVVQHIDPFPVRLSVNL